MQRFYHRERGAFLSLASAAKRLQQTPFRYQHRRSDRWIQRTDVIWDWGSNFRNRTTAAFRQSSAIHFPLLYLFILCVVPSPRRPLLILRVESDPGGLVSQLNFSGIFRVNTDRKTSNIDSDSPNLQLNTQTLLILLPTDGWRWPKWRGAHGGMCTFPSLCPSLCLFWCHREEWRCRSEGGRGERRGYVFNIIIRTLSQVATAAAAEWEKYIVEAVVRKQDFFTVFCVKALF